MKFISFGSGSSGNCYYLFTDREGLIIDAGIGLRTLKKYAREYGANLSIARYILITHDHADHVKSVGSLSYELQLPVYSTAGVHEGIGRNYCVAKKISPDFVRHVEKGATIELGDFRVTLFGVPHDSRDCVGYFIEADGTNLCLITDVGEITDEIKPFISRAHYLVIEANHDEEMLMNGPYSTYLKNRIRSNTGHLSNRACGEALAQNATGCLRHVWLCHLSEENNHPELARKTVETVLRSYGIAPGTDFQLDVLKRKTPCDVVTLE